jgi:hypothetical protein
MATQRVLLTGLLICTLLAPGALPTAPRRVTLPLAAAHQANASSSSPDRAASPEDHPWQPNVPVYSFLPDCTDQERPDIAVDAADNLYLLWNDYRDGSSNIYFAYRVWIDSWC